MQSHFQSFWAHCWSLSVEEHFYLVLPIVLIASARFSKPNFAWIPFACPVIVLSCLALRASLGPQATSQQALMPTPLRLDSLFAGITLSWFYHFREAQFSRVHSNWLPPLSALLVGWQFLWDEPSYLRHTLGFTANLISFALVLAWAINTTALFKLKPLASIGRYSYSIYFWHVAIGILFWRLFGTSFISFWAYLVVAIGFGVAMSALIEIPSLALRDRLLPDLSRRRREGERLGWRDQAADMVNA